MLNNSEVLPKLRDRIEKGTIIRRAALAMDRFERGTIRAALAFDSRTRSHRGWLIPKGISAAPDRPRSHGNTSLVKQ
ncbi:unnamed protein product, partial [Iphiclides podalirius]